MNLSTPPDRIEWWSRIFAARTRGEVGGGLAAILSLAGATDLISFAGGFPDPDTFPGPVLAQILQELLASGDSSALQYAPTQGLPGPRAFLRERLARTEGVEPSEQQLVITSGNIECLELLGKSLLDPGDEVVTEAPTYLGAIMAFRSFQADVVAIPVDSEGLEVDVLEDMLSAGRRPKFLYTIPDYQNPGGVSLSAPRRPALIEVARRYGLLIVEDVAYRELGFDGVRRGSLWSIGSDTVVQAGTFSKTFFPGVRLGWAAGPTEIVQQLVLTKQNTDQCAGALGQRLLEEYGRRGLLDVQNERACELYRRRCGLLMDALDRYMPPDVRWTRPTGGFFSWLTLPPGVDSMRLAEEALREGVAFVPGAPFFADGRGLNNVRLSFSRVDDDLIEEGARRLGGLFRRALGGR